MNQLRLAWTLGASLFAFVACGSSDQPSHGSAGAPADSSSGASGGPAASAGSGTSDNPGSAGSRANGGAAGAAGVAAAAGTAGQNDANAAYSGTVQVGWQDGGQAFTTSVQARFHMPNQATGSTCTTEVIGPCSVQTCVAAPAALTVPQAGIISVSNGDKLNATLTPNSDGSYPNHSEPNVLLPGEDNVTITATGGDVPAFSGTIIQPLTLLVSNPLGDSTGQVSWARDMDLALTFDRGAAGVQMLVQGGVSPGVIMRCYFPSESGQALIPTHALQAMPSATILGLYTVKSDHITAGDYTVSFLAFSSAMDQAKKRGIRIHLQ